MKDHVSQQHESKHDFANLLMYTPFSRHCIYRSARLQYDWEDNDELSVKRGGRGAADQIPQALGIHKQSADSALLESRLTAEILKCI